MKLEFNLAIITKENQKIEEVIEHYYNKTNTNLQKKKGFSFYGIGRNFMNIGMFMAEGKNFNSSNNKRRIKNYTPTIKKNKEKSEKNNEKEEKSKSGK